MRKAIIFSFISLLFFSCDDHKIEQNEVAIDFSTNVSFGLNSDVKKPLIIAGGEEFKVKSNYFDGGVNFTIKKKKRFFGKKKITLFGILASQKPTFENIIKLQESLKVSNLIGFESGFKTVQFADTTAEVFFQEGIEKQLIESNRNREGIIFSESEGGIKVIFKPKRAKDVSLEDLKQRYSSWKSSSLSTACFFDVVKTKKVIELWKASNLDKHITGVAFYLNPVSNLVEPLLYYTNDVKESSKILDKEFQEVLTQKDSSSCFSTENFEKYFEQDEESFGLKSDVKVISENVIIPSGVQISITNKELDLVEGAFILSFSPVTLNGFSLQSSDSTGRGFHVINARGKSLVKNSKFNALKSLSYENWNLPSAVTFYESPVDVFNSQFLNNDCEDGLNLFRSFPFVLDSCVFENTFSDAFDADFSDGTIKNTVFRKLGNDGIDVSGSNVNILNCEFIDVADKALSSGEASAMHVDNILVDGASLAITAKDKSTIDIANSEIKNSEVVFCAFQKKKEFGPSQIEGKNVKFSEFKRDFLVEERSSLIIDGKAITKFEKDVKKILYGNEYGKATVK